MCFFVLLLSHWMRGRIWFHNEIHVFSTVFLCLLVCNGLLASKAHLIFFLYLSAFWMYKGVQCVFYLKNNNFTFWVCKGLFLLSYQKYWIPNAATSWSDICFIFCFITFLLLNVWPLLYICLTGPLQARVTLWTLMSNDLIKISL